MPLTSSNVGKQGTIPRLQRATGTFLGSQKWCRSTPTIAPADVPPVRVRREESDRSAEDKSEVCGERRFLCPAVRHNGVHAGRSREGVRERFESACLPVRLRGAHGLQYHLPPFLRGCSSEVEHQPSKLGAPVQIRSLAPRPICCAYTKRPPPFHRSGRRRASPLGGAQHRRVMNSGWLRPVKKRMRPVRAQG